MAVYQGSLTVKRRAKDGGPGKPGKDGIDIQIDNPNLIVTENSGSRDYSKTGFKIKVVQGGHSFNYFGADMTVLQERSWTCDVIEVNNITGFTPPGPYPAGVTNAVFPPITGLSGDAGYIVLRFHIRDATMVYQFVDKRIQYNLSGKSGKDAINIHIDSTNLVVLESGGERDYSNTGLKIRITQGGWNLDYLGVYASYQGTWLCWVAESSNVTGFTLPLGDAGVYDLNIPPITKLTGSSGYVVLRFDITDRYGVRQFTDRRIQYTVTGKGYDGMPGQVPIQKEWVVGDTHRFNDEIKDYIYVRGTSQNTSYWYTRTNKGDVTAGSPPVGGANKAGYTRVDWLKTLAVNVLLVEEGNLANFIFKDEKLISVRGTVNGVLTNYSGQQNFMPNIVIDGKTGEIIAGGDKFRVRPDGSGFLANGNIKWNVAGNTEFLGGVKSPFTDISNATIAQFWQEEITSWANNFFENQYTTSLAIRIIPCRNLLNGQVFRIHALRRGILLQPEEYNGFYENGTLLNEIQLNKSDAIEMVCICYGNVFHSWDIVRRYKCRPYDL